MIKQCNYKQFSLAFHLFVHCLNVKQLCLIDRTLSGATTPGQSYPGSNGNDEYSAFLKAPALLDLYHQFVYCQIQDTRSRNSTPLQRCRRCIQQPLPTGLSKDGCKFGSFTFNHLAFYKETTKLPLWKINFRNPDSAKHESGFNLICYMANKRK